MEKTPIICNQGLAKQFRNHVEPCSFGTVKRYVFNPESAIEVALLVPAEFHLHQVAALADTRRGDILGKLLEQKKLVLAVRTVWPGIRYQDSSVSIEVFADDRLCDTIYVPPVYFVQFRGVDDLAEFIVDSEHAFLNAVPNRMQTI